MRGRTPLGLLVSRRTRMLAETTIRRSVAGAFVATLLAVVIGCDALDGIDPPESPNGNGSEGGASICQVAPPCSDQLSVETCVGTTPSCTGVGGCDPQSNLALPCVGSGGCASGDVCCALVPATGLKEGDCFGALEVNPANTPSSACQDKCAAGTLQLCTTDAQCGAAAPCYILAIQGPFMVSVGFCLGSAS